MKGYKLTLGQKKAIEKTQFAPGEFFHPVQDALGNWFIFEEEMKRLILNKAFRELNLEEYVLPIDTTI